MHGRKRVNLILLIGMSALVIYFVMTMIRQQDEFSVILSEIHSMEHKIGQEEARREELLEQQSKADTDEFIESVAREKLGMVKLGERLFVDSK